MEGWEGYNLSDLGIDYVCVYLYIYYIQYIYIQYIYIQYIQGGADYCKQFITTVSDLDTMSGKAEKQKANREG